VCVGGGGGNDLSTRCGDPPIDGVVGEDAGLPPELPPAHLARFSLGQLAVLPATTVIQCTYTVVLMMAKKTLSVT
jgi:hypothetical protein